MPYDNPPEINGTNESWQEYRCYMVKTLARCVKRRDNLSTVIIRMQVEQAEIRTLLKIRRRIRRAQTALALAVFSILGGGGVSLLLTYLSQ
jgi:hypothetical protein